MALLSKEKEAIKNNYFSLWEIVSLLAKKADDDLQEVGEFLGHVNISTEIQVYKRDQFSRLYQLDLEWNNNPVDEVVSILNGIFPFDSKAKQEAAKKKARVKAIGLYWLKEDIYNFSPIMELGLIERPPAKVITVNTPIETPNYISILALNDFFSIEEAACFISFDEPEKVIALIENHSLDYDAWRYGEHKQAVKVIENGIRANKLDIESDGMIPRTSLQKFLLGRNHIIKGFNDQLTTPPNNESTQEHTDIENTITSLELDLVFNKYEVEQLKKQLQEKDAEITKLKEQFERKEKELLQQPTIQINQDESELTNKRAENGVTKLVLVLAEMAQINIDKPHAIHESLQAQADLLGIDKFPSDDTVKKWLIKANNHKNSQNPN